MISKATELKLPSRKRSAVVNLRPDIAALKRSDMGEVFFVLDPCFLPFVVATAGPFGFASSELGALIQRAIKLLIADKQASGAPVVMVDLIGLAIPVAYVGILVGSLATFSSLYRKRKAAKSTSLEPWFGPHVQRNIYLSLLHLEPPPGQEKATPVPDSVLKAALLQRASEDIRRILAIKGAKQPLSQLLQRGSIGDELWQRFLRAEKEMEAELRDVVEEANALATGWGQTIFQSANEMVNNAILREKVAELQAKGREDREWWDKERASIQSKFMQELNEEKPAEATKGAASGGVNSDEDAVLVEGGGPASGSTPGSKGGTKKKKGKK